MRRLFLRLKAQRAQKLKKVLISLMALVLCAFLLCSCAPESTTQKKSLELTLSPFTMPEKEDRGVTLYSVSEDGNLTAFSTQLSPEGSLYDNIMSALLFGTEDGYKSIFPQGITCRSTMPVQNILYIDLSWQFSMCTPEELFNCLAVLSATFTSLKEIDFINLTVEGQQLFMPNLKNIPVMLLSAYSTRDVLLGRYNEFVAQRQLGNKIVDTFYGIVYSADSQGKYLIPKVQSITATDENYALALCTNLINTAESIFPEGFGIKSTPFFDEESATVTVKLSCPSSFKPQASWLGPKSIAATLNSLYPTAKRIRLSVVNELGAEVFTLDEETVRYYSYIKSEVEVIIPNSSGNGLAKATMLVSNMPGGDFVSFIKEYVCFVAPALKEKDILVNGITVNNDTVIIDLSQSCYDHFLLGRELSQNEEYALVYSIISTACNYTGCTKAYLLQDNQMRSTFGGNIALDRALLALPESYLQTLK